MEIIMAIGEVGISGFDKNFTFSSRYSISPSILHPFPKTPNSRISLNSHKSIKNRIFIAKATELVDTANFIDKQTDFQPAFHEYLKAMESVKTDRENKPLKDANSGDNPTAKYVWRAPRERLEGNGDIIEAGSEGGVSSDKPRQKGVNNTEPRSRQRGNGVYKNRDSTGRSKIELEDKDSSKFGRREGFSKKGVIERNQGSVRLKFEQKGNDIDLHNREGFGGNEVNGRAEKINRTWMNAVTTTNQGLLGTDRKANVVKRLESNEDLDGGNLDQKKYTDVWKKPLNSNTKEVTTRVGNTGRAGDFVGISKRNREQQQSYSSSIGNKTSESTLDRTLIEWEGVSTDFSKMELGETDNWKTEHMKSSDRSKVGRQIYDSDIRITKERADSNGIQRGTRPNRNEYEANKLGSRSTNVDIILDRDRIRTEDDRCKVSPRSGNVSKGRKLLKEHNGENDMDMERAAFKSFEVFTDLRGQPRVLRMEMEERIQHLAKWLNGTDINLPEWLFSKMIHSARIRFSDHSILRVIQILGSLGNWRRALQVIEWFQSRERFKSYKSRYIYTAALDVLGKAKRPVEALNVFHLMRQGMSSYPDLAAYHCIAVTLGQAGYLKELFDVIDCMRSPPPTKFKTGFVENWDPRLEPDIIIYNAVLNACARRKQWEGAFWVLQQLKQQGLQPSSTTYGLTMEVMFACEKYNLVYEFFRKVEKSTIPNSLNYKVLVNSLWKEGKTDDAVFAVEDMERRGIVGSASLYYDLARCLCTAGRCQEALMQMDKICKVAHKPLVVTYTGLIQSCLDAGNVQNGAYIFKQMQEFCSPNLVTCNIMLKAYLEHRMWEDAKDLFQKMLDESCRIQRRSDLRNIVTPDSYTFNTMLDAYAAEQKWDDFSYVFQHMLQRGHKFNTKRHLRHILEACRAGKGELLETTWKDLSQANRLPPPPLVKERFCMKLEENDYTAAISSITIHMTNDPPLQAFTEKGWLDLLKMNTDRFQKDTIVRLTHELNNLVAGSHQPHPVILNLISSCREFVRTHYIADEINPDPIEFKEDDPIVNLAQ